VKRHRKQDEPKEEIKETRGPGKKRQGNKRNRKKRHRKQE